VGVASDLPAGRHCAPAAQNHRDRRTAGQQSDQVREEFLALVLVVVRLGHVLVRLVIFIATMVSPTRSKRSRMGATRPRATASGLKTISVSSIGAGAMRSSRCGWRRFTQLALGDGAPIMRRRDHKPRRPARFEGGCRMCPSGRARIAALVKKW